MNDAVNLSAIYRSVPWHFTSISCILPKTNIENKNFQEHVLAEQRRQTVVLTALPKKACVYRI